MKVLQIAPSWIDSPPKNYGGTEWVISNLVKGFSELGHDITLFATKKSRSSGKLSYVFEKCLVDLDIPWEAALPALLHYHQAFKQADQYDIVHAHLSSCTDLVILPFLADLTDRGIPNVITIHGHWPYDRDSNIDPYFLNLYAHKITAFSISKTMEKKLPKQYINGGVMYNSTDLAAYKFNKHGGNYVTWIGKILSDKGTHLAIQAAKKLGLQIIFAGIVDKGVPASVEYFDKKVKPLIDGKKVIYLGPADLKMKNKLLGNAKAFLNPICWEEPFGMVMVESMACGTPVISFNRGAAPEVIADNKTGFLVQDLREMVNVMKKIDTISRYDCRLHIEEHFSPSVAAENHIKAYKQVIKDTQSQGWRKLAEIIKDRSGAINKKKKKLPDDLHSKVMS